MSTPNYNFKLSTGGHVPTMQALNDGLTKVDRQLFMMESTGRVGGVGSITPMTYIRGGEIRRLSPMNPMFHTMMPLECYIPAVGRICRTEFGYDLAPSSGPMHFFAAPDPNNEELCTIVTYNEAQVRWLEYMPTAWTNARGERYLGTAMIPQSPSYPSVDMIEGETIYSADGVSVMASNIMFREQGVINRPINLGTKVPRQQVTSISMSFRFHVTNAGADAFFRAWIIGHNGHRILIGTEVNSNRHIDKLPVTPGDPKIDIIMEGRNLTVSRYAFIQSFTVNR